MQYGNTYGKLSYCWDHVVAMPPIPSEICVRVEFEMALLALTRPNNKFRVEIDLCVRHIEIDLCREARARPWNKRAVQSGAKDRGHSCGVMMMIEGGTPFAESLVVNKCSTISILDVANTCNRGGRARQAIERKKDGRNGRMSSIRLKVNNKDGPHRQRRPSIDDSDVYRCGDVVCGVFAKHRSNS